MGVGEHDHEVYLVDFGLAKKFRDPKTHLHIPYREHCPPTGTTSYISINNHLGVEWSRRDDIESLTYILLYFLRGSLPWHAIRAVTSEQEHNKILQLKMKSALNLYPACPSEFSMFLDYARGLAFDEKPDYDYLHSLFRKLLICEGHQYGHPFAKCILSNNLCDQAVGGRGKTRRKVLQENNVPHFADKV
jgi:serine/threonine protein kinase